MRDNKALANRKNFSVGKKVVASKKPTSKKVTSLDILGENIKYKRTSLGMSIEKTASLCGIGSTTLIRMESGGETKMSTILNVLAMLGMKLEITGALDE